MKNKIVWIVIILVVIVGVVMATNNSKPTIGGPVKIGVVIPLTGGAASIGETAMDIMNIAREEVNSSGGINGYDLEFVFEDGACEGATAANATQKLVNVDGLKIVTGIICSGEAIASIPIIDQANGFMLGLTPTSPDLTDVSENFARMFPSDAGQAKALADYANSKFAKVGIINEETEYALGNKNFFIKNYKGETVVESFKSDTTDVRTNISKIKSENVDGLLVIVQTPATADIVLKQLSTSGITSEIMVDVVIATSPEIVEKYSDFLTNSISAQVMLDNDQEIKALRGKYEEISGQEMQYEAYMMAVYDGVKLLADALNEEGYNPDSVAKYVYNVKNRPGLSGSITIDENGDRTGGYVLQRYNGSELESVN